MPRAFEGHAKPSKALFLRDAACQSSWAYGRGQPSLVELGWGSVYEWFQTRCRTIRLRCQKCFKVILPRYSTPQQLPIISQDGIIATFLRKVSARRMPQIVLPSEKCLVGACMRFHCLQGCLKRNIWNRECRLHAVKSGNEFSYVISASLDQPEWTLPGNGSRV
jgi:hypothetical protein